MFELGLQFITSQHKSLCYANCVYVENNAFALMGPVLSTSFVFGTVVSFLYTASFCLTSIMSECLEYGSRW